MKAGSIDTAPFNQGYLSMRAMIEMLKGAAVPKKIMLPLTFVTKQNVDTWLKPPAERPRPDWNAVLKSNA